MNKQPDQPDLSEGIATQVRPVLEKFQITKAILFGSFATRRQSRRSDVDLILVQNTDKSYFERFEGLLTALHKAIPKRDIEVFIYTPKELSAMRDRKFIQRALQEGKVIYERR